MNGGSFGYLIKQGVHSAWLNRVMTLASIGILTACLILVGCTGLLALNIRDTFKAVEDETEMIVYVDDSATPAQSEQLGHEIEKINGVLSVEFISKADAIAIQKESLGDQGYLLDGLGEFLPSGYRVYVDGLDNMIGVQNEISGLDNVLEIYVPTQLVEILTGIRNIVGILGGILIIILIIASIVVISNTIKLTVFSRRREISIMKYVGATNRFIRLPFIVEGLTIGFWASILAFLIVMGVYQGLAQMITTSNIGWLSSVRIIPFWDVWYWVLGLFAASGMLIGSFGSASAMRKHLKV